ncbi:MAG: CBS domain-containing protein, partial [Sediminibacterium sp.]|nr:CBS domain-containing protein [Sediminibacterium sp.]
RLNKYLVKTNKIQEKIKEDKSELIDLIDKNFSQSSFEKKILKRTLDFHQLQVKQIMRIKLKVIAFDYNITSTELITQLLKHKYSRYPVYRDSLDHIVGIIFTKDILYNKELIQTNWQQFLQPVYFILETKKTEDLLTQFDEACIHFAVVVNEYGETEGIVTLEDILEEIVGEIEDEFSEDSQDVVKLDTENFIIDGKMLIVDFEKYFNFPCANLLSNMSGVHTMAGFFIEFSQSIPHINDKISFPTLNITIQEIDKYRIKKLLINLIKNEI